MTNLALRLRNRDGRAPLLARQSVWSSDPKLVNLWDWRKEFPLVAYDSSASPLPRHKVVVDSSESILPDHILNSGRFSAGLGLSRRRKSLMISSNSVRAFS